MKEITTIKDIDRKTAEGLTLWRALIMLTVEIYPKECVEDILKRINMVRL